MKTSESASFPHFPSQISAALPDSQYLDSYREVGKVRLQLYTQKIKITDHQYERVALGSGDYSTFTAFNLGWMFDEDQGTEVH